MIDLERQSDAPQKFPRRNAEKRTAGGSARKQLLFRDVNELIERAMGFIAPGQNGDKVEIFCECGLADCTQKLIVSMAEYEAARSTPARFLVAAGHEIPDAENVVVNGETEVRGLRPFEDDQVLVSF